MLLQGDLAITTNNITGLEITDSLSIVGECVVACQIVKHTHSYSHNTTGLCTGDCTNNLSSELCARAKWR